MTERGISMPVKERAESSLQQAFALRAKNILKKPDFLSYTRDQITEFRRAIDTSVFYTPEDRALIHSALNLAIVAYQDNDHVSRRMRKQTVVVNDERVPVPYIQHPLSVASAMIGEPREVPMSEVHPQTYDQVVLKVHQHPYKAEVVAAALLHDVIEDVRLRKPNRGIFVEGRNNWTGFLRTYFDGTQPKKVDSMITMIDAVTKRSPLREQMKINLMASEVFLAVRNQISGSEDRSWSDVDDQVIRTLSDLHYMVQTCFGMGATVFDDNAFMNFYGALAVKCHDIENNLEDGGVREDKRVRAQILAIFARIYGLPVASRIAAHLVIDTQHDMFWGEGNKEKNLRAAIKLVDIYARLERQREKPSFTFLKEDKNKGVNLQADAVQIPVFSQDEVVNTPGFRPVPQFKFITDNDDFLRDVRNRYFGPEGTYLPIRTRKFDYVGVPIYEETQTAIIESGRECYYFNVYRKKDVLSDPDNAKLIAIVRIQDDQPTAHDILRQGSFIRPTRVPESKLISHVYDGSVDGSMRVFSVATSNEL